MIRYFVRFYSHKRRSPARGCRILDYRSPRTHLTVSPPNFLLSSRSGYRYENLDPHYDDRQELLTILNIYRKRPKAFELYEEPPELVSEGTHQHLITNGLYAKLGIDPKTPPHSLDFAALNVSDKLQVALDFWSDIILAPNLSLALKLSAQHSDIPAFVALHVLSRHADTPLDVHNSLRQYEQWMPHIPEHFQPELTVLMLRMAQRKLVDIVPVIIQLFLANYKRDIPPRVLNELLWQIAHYGKQWSLVDTPLLSQAQEALISATGVDKIDVKGLVALAYIKHFRHPEVARKAIVNLTGIVAGRTPAQSSKEFAYSAGPLIMRLLTSSNAEEALLIVDEARTHLPAVWSALAVFLSRNHLLTSEVALNLWNQMINRIRENSPGLRVTNLFVEMILSSLSTFAQKQRVLASAIEFGLHLTPSIVAKMMNVNSAHDLDTAKLAFPTFLRHPLVQEQILKTQSYVDSPAVWDTYTKLYRGRIPSRVALKCICRAAWDGKLLWGDMYAAQRALREVKLHVRGTAAPGNDILRLYPDDELLYAYVVMAGRSGYHEELMNFLPWMNEIQHDPSKRVLLALVYYSPMGPALLRMSQKMPHDQWPTMDEFEAYKQMLEGD